MIFTIYKTITGLNLLLNLANKLRILTMSKEKKKDHEEHFKNVEKELYESAKILGIDENYMKNILKTKDENILFRLGCILVLSACPVLHIISLFGNIKTLYENK